MRCKILSLSLSETCTKAHSSSNKEKTKSLKKYKQPIFGSKYGSGHKAIKAWFGNIQITKTLVKHHKQESIK